MKKHQAQEAIAIPKSRLKASTKPIIGNISISSFDQCETFANKTG